jgi:hypothetical protein
MAAANIIESLLGDGGLGSLASGVGDIVCSAKGNCQPENVTNITQAPASNNSMILLLGGGVIVVILMIVLLKK